MTQIVKGADRIPLFGDCVFVDGFPLDDKAQGTPPPDPPPLYDGWREGVDGAWNYHEINMFCLPRPEGAVNFAFLDGSVGAVPLRALWKLKWHKNFDTNWYWATSSAVWPKWMLKFGDEY